MRKRNANQFCLRKKVLRRRITSAFDIETLPWSAEEDTLEDGAEYLIEMAHGMISGLWISKEGIFIDYYSNKLQHNGRRWIKIAESPAR